MEPSETLLSCLCARELLRYSLAWRQNRKGLPFIPTEGTPTALWQHRVSNIAMQFGKGPTRGLPLGFPLLPTGFITPFPFGTFTDMGQVFQSNDRVRVLFHNATTDTMLAILLQPSLSSANRYQATGCGTRAFLLQAFSKSRVVVGFGSHLFRRIECDVVLWIGRHCQVALTYIYPNNLSVSLRCVACSLYLEGNQQVGLLMRLVVLEFGCSNLSAVLDESHMQVVPCVRNDHPSCKGQGAHPLFCLEAMITLVVVAEGRSDIPGCFIQAFVAFPGPVSLACCMLLSTSFCKWPPPDEGHYKPFALAICRWHVSLHRFPGARLADCSSYHVQMRSGLQNSAHLDM